MRRGTGPDGKQRAGFRSKALILAFRASTPLATAPAATVTGEPPVVTTPGTPFTGGGDAVTGAGSVAMTVPGAIAGGGGDTDGAARFRIGPSARHMLTAANLSGEGHTAMVAATARFQRA